jgi:hypothetical protein
MSFAKASHSVDVQSRCKELASSLRTTIVQLQEVERKDKDSAFSLASSVASVASSSYSSARADQEALRRRTTKEFNTRLVAAVLQFFRTVDELDELEMVGGGGADDNQQDAQRREKLLWQRLGGDGSLDSVYDNEKLSGAHLQPQHRRKFLASLRCLRVYEVGNAHFSFLWWGGGRQAHKHAGRQTGPDTCWACIILGIHVCMRTVHWWVGRAPPSRQPSRISARASVVARADTRGLA